MVGVQRADVVVHFHSNRGDGPVQGRRRTVGRLGSVEQPLKQIVGAAILDSLTEPSELLVARRTAPESLAGLWEFPGGKVEPGEGCEAALLREIREELGVDVQLGSEVLGPLEQGWQLNGTAAMRVWNARILDGEPRPLEDHDELRWVPLRHAELNALPWIPADLPIITAVLETVEQADTARS